MLREASCKAGRSCVAGSRGAAEGAGGPDSAARLQGGLSARRCTDEGWAGGQCPRVYMTWLNKNVLPPAGKQHWLLDGLQTHFLSVYALASVGYVTVRHAGGFLHNSIITIGTMRFK